MATTTPNRIPILVCLEETTEAVVGSNTKKTAPPPPPSGGGSSFIRSSNSDKAATVRRRRALTQQPTSAATASPNNNTHHQNVAVVSPVAPPVLDAPLTRASAQRTVNDTSSGTNSGNDSSRGSDDDDPLLAATSTTNFDSRRVTQLEQLIVRMRGQLQEKNLLFGKLEAECASRAKKEVTALQQAHEVLVRNLRTDACALDVQVRALTLQSDQLRGKLRQAEDGLRAECNKHRDCRVQLSMAEKDLVVARQSAEAAIKQAAHGRKLLREQLHDAKQQLADKERKLVELQQMLTNTASAAADTIVVVAASDASRCDVTGSGATAATTTSADNANTSNYSTSSPGPRCHDDAHNDDPSSIPSSSGTPNRVGSPVPTNAPPPKQRTASTAPVPPSASASPLPRSGARRGRSLSYTTAASSGQQERRGSEAPPQQRIAALRTPTLPAPATPNDVQAVSHQKEIDALHLDIAALKEKGSVECAAHAATEAALNERILQLEDALRGATAREQTLQQRYEDATETYEAEISSLAANLSKWRESQQARTRNNAELSQLRAMSIEDGSVMDVVTHRAPSGVVVEAGGVVGDAGGVGAPPPPSSVYTSSPTGSSPPPPLPSSRGPYNDYDALVDECSSLHVRVTEQSDAIQKLEATLHATVERKALLEESRRGLLGDVAHLQLIVQTYCDIAPADVTRHVNSHCSASLTALRVHAATGIGGIGPHGKGVPHHYTASMSPAPPSSSIPRSPSSVLGLCTGARRMTVDDLATVDSDVGTTTATTVPQHNANAPDAIVPLLPWGRLGAAGMQRYHLYQQHPSSPTPSFLDGGDDDGASSAAAAAAGGGSSSSALHNQQLRVIRRMQEDIALLRRQMYTDYWFTTDAAAAVAEEGARGSGVGRQAGVGVCGALAEPEQPESAPLCANNSVAGRCDPTSTDPTSTMPHCSIGASVSGDESSPDARGDLKRSSSERRRVTAALPSLSATSAFVAIAGVLFMVVSSAAFSSWLTSHGPSGGSS